LGRYGITKTLRCGELAIFDLLICPSLSYNNNISFNRDQRHDAR